MTKCNCDSYNQGDGTGTPEVILYPKDPILTGGRESVCVDSCISGVISHLWDVGLPTLNSCCGHNKSEPSVVIPEGNDPQNYLSVIAEIDSRDWTVFMWGLVGHRRIK